MSQNNRLLLGLAALSLVAVAWTHTISSNPTAHSATVRRNVNPSVDIPVAKTKGEQTIVFAGGCFWGVEAVFEKLKGVSSATAGYAGGPAVSANYGAVSSGTTGHAEAVKITYNPAQISYGQLLKIYFLIAHDPTQRDRQGPDRGPQYRSAIFVPNSDEQAVAKAYTDQLDRAQVFAAPIVTQVVPLTAFYAAETQHQDFIDRNPNYPYVVVHDLPKLAQLQQQFPNLIKKG